MIDWFETHKPAASQWWHLLLASMMWSAVGLALLVFGARWLVQAEPPHLVPLIAAAVVAGVAKSRLMLDRVARRLVERILTRGEGRCIGGFLSLRTWLLVAVMVGGGSLLRGGSWSRTVVGLVYVAVGTALVLGARKLWRAWYQRHVSTRTRRP